MSSVELAYLIVSIGAFAVFAATLAWVDWHSNRQA